jgi:hypothetical protein
VETGAPCLDIDSAIDRNGWNSQSVTDVERVLAWPLWWLPGSTVVRCHASKCESRSDRDEAKSYSAGNDLHVKPLPRGRNWWSRITDAVAVPC